MTNTKSISRVLIVGVVGIFAIAMLSLAMAPPAGLFG